MDGRKRLSGAHYKKSAKEKKKRQDDVLSKTRKIDLFYKNTATAKNGKYNKLKTYCNVQWFCCLH